MGSADTIQEELLVIRSIAGDRQAFEELVGRWQERLHRHALHLTGDDEAAWDAVQEAWVAVVDGIRRLREPAAFGGWIFRILGAKCADWVRRQQRQRALSERVAQDVAEQGRLSDDHIALHQAVGRLPVNQRELLSLRYGLGYDTAEIAQLLGIPAGTVKSRLYQAREQLRTLLEHEDERQV